MNVRGRVRLRLRRLDVVHISMVSRVSRSPVPQYGTVCHLPRMTIDSLRNTFGLRPNTTWRHCGVAAILDPSTNLLNDLVIF